MTHTHPSRSGLAATLVAGLVLGGGVARAVTFSGPTSSQPLALDAAGTLLAVVNPDKDSVSFFDVSVDKKKRPKKFAVQDEPWGVAILPDGAKAYVTNTVSGTVSVVARNTKGKLRPPELHIPVGTEPYGLALTPNGTRIYVTNARSSSVSVIDTATDTVIATIANVGFEPRGLAITNDGDADDTDETVYVTQSRFRRRWRGAQDCEWMLQGGGALTVRSRVGQRRLPPPM